MISGTYLHLWFCVLPAHKNGRFDAELAPIEVKGKKGVEVFTSDEHPRGTSLEKLGSLKPVFKENGLVSAGNASVSSRVYIIYASIGQ